jgi:hypothetical protein
MLEFYLVTLSVILSILQVVTKDLWISAKLKSCYILGEWHKSIRNAMWWAFQHCKGKLSSYAKSVVEPNLFVSSPAPPIIKIQLCPYTVLKTKW